MPVDREREALDELGRTDATRPVALALVGVFLLLVTLPGVVHLAQAPGPVLERAGAIPMALVAKPSRPFEGSRDTLKAIDGFETELRNGSPMARWVRPRVQRWMFEAAGVGNAQVVVGHDAPGSERQGPVLYFRPSVQHAMGLPFLDPTHLLSRSRGGAPWEVPPQPDPRPVIRHLAEDLAQRGVELMVVPVPVKASVDTDGLGLSRDLRNPSWQRLRAHLERLGVAGPDALELLLAEPAPRFLETDTHWRPKAAHAVAAKVADDLVERGVVRSEPLRRDKPVRHVGEGDLADLLGMAPGIVAPDKVWVSPLVHAPDPEDASVLVLGDSFVGIYDDPSLGFGGDGGFVDSLAHHLGQPVDAVVVNAGGATQVRQALADQVDRLEGIDVVVWVFTARELSHADWREVRLPRVDAVVDPRWVDVEPGEQRGLTGRITALAAAADPRESPYADQLVSVSIAVEGRAPGSEGSEVWGYAWGLQDRALQPAAFARVGQEVTLEAKPFAEAPQKALRAGRAEASGRPSGVPLLWLTWEAP